MIQRIARKMHKLDAEEGFTLIELMVVVLIIGILIAIAVPTFLGARTRAQNKAAESSLRNALTAAKTAFTDNDNYLTATVTELNSIEPSLTFVGAGATGTTDSNHISSVVGDNNQTNDSWSAAAYSASGTCFYILDVSTSGTGHAAGTFYGSGAAGTTGCTATAIGTALPKESPTAGGGGW